MFELKRIKFASQLKNQKIVFYSKKSYTFTSGIVQQSTDSTIKSFIDNNLLSVLYETIKKYIFSTYHANKF